MSCHGASRWARTARYSGCSKKPWRGGFSRSRSGKPGTVSSQPQWTASVHMRWRAEVSRLMVPVAAPAARRASWYWRIWIRGERGGSRGAAEEGGEMGDPATGGADGPELPDLVVLEVGVDEGPQGRPLGAERAHASRRSSGRPCSIARRAFHCASSGRCIYESHGLLRVPRGPWLPCGLHRIVPADRRRR